MHVRRLSHAIFATGLIGGRLRRQAGALARARGLASFDEDEMDEDDEVDGRRHDGYGSACVIPYHYMVDVDIARTASRVHRRPRRPLLVMKLRGSPTRCRRRLSSSSLPVSCPKRTPTSPASSTISPSRRSRGASTAPSGSTSRSFSRRAPCASSTSSVSSRCARIHHIAWQSLSAHPQEDEISFCLSEPMLDSNGIPFTEVEGDVLVVRVVTDRSSSNVIMICTDSKSRLPP